MKGRRVSVDLTWWLRLVSNVHVTLKTVICYVYSCSLVPRPLFFRFCLVTVKKRVWWISTGRFVLQTPRFWELLIGVNNYKGHPLTMFLCCVRRSRMRTRQRNIVKRMAFFSPSPNKNEKIAVWERD